MTVQTSLTVGAGGDANSNFVLQEALSAYSDEAYTNARKLSGTGIVGSNPEIDTSTETYIGQVRWYKPLNPTVNVASLTDSTDGVKTSYSQDYLNYIKTVRTHGAMKVNLSQVITQEDGLMKIGKDFGETQSQDEHDAILAVCRGVMISELLNGAASGQGVAGLGGQTFDNDPTDKRYGFYVDLGAVKPVVDSTTTIQGAARAEGFLDAIGMAWKDYEPDYAYLVVSPSTMASLRSANLVDQTTVTEGNVVFSTIFNGKFRIIQTRASQGLLSSEFTMMNSGPGLDLAGAAANTRTSFIILPGSIAMQALTVPMPTEIDRAASAYKGGGTTSIWYRWGYVLAPAGYNWDGPQTAFPTNDDYQSVMESSAITPLASATSGLVTGGYVKGVWERKTASALSLGILPVFHN